MTLPADLLSRFDAQMRRDRPPGPSQRLEREPRITRLLGDVPGAEFGAVLWTDIDDETADAAIEDELRRFTAMGRPFEWKTFGHDRPADLGERLARRGFRPGDKETIVCRSLASAIAAPVPDGIVIRRLDDARGLDSLRKLDEAIGEANDALWDELHAEMTAAPDRIGVYVAWAGAAPVSRAWVRCYPDREFADLWGGHTKRELRGRGIYKAMVAVRAEEARRRGAKWLATDALPSSRPILERLGFEPLVTTTPYLWLPL